MNLEECYQMLGADYEGVMRRLMTEERVKRFLLKVIEDPCFSNLSLAMDAADYEEAFRAAHTIKGISVNMGLNALADSSSALTERLRGGQYGTETEKLYKQVMVDYQKTIEVVRTLG